MSTSISANAHTAPMLTEVHRRASDWVRSLRGQHSRLGDLQLRDLSADRIHGKCLPLTGQYECYRGRMVPAPIKVDGFCQLIGFRSDQALQVIDLARTARRIGRQFCMQRRHALR